MAGSLLEKAEALLDRGMLKPSEFSTATALGSACGWTAGATLHHGGGQRHGEEAKKEEEKKTPPTGNPIKSEFASDLSA